MYTRIRSVDVTIQRLDQNINYTGTLYLIWKHMNLPNYICIV